MRNKIKEKLLELESSERIHYGKVPDVLDYNDWNYFVFGQSKMRKSGTSSNDLNGYWYVAIVRESYLPDEDVKNVINKMCSIPGLRLADGDYIYDYATNGNTNNVVEMVLLTFTKTKKGIVE